MAFREHGGGLGLRCWQGANALDGGERETGAIGSMAGGQFFSEAQRSVGRRSTETQRQLGPGCHPCECRPADKQVRGQRRYDPSHPNRNKYLRFPARKRISFSPLRSARREFFVLLRSFRPWLRRIRDKRGSKKILE